MNEETKSLTPEKARNRRLVFAAVTMFVLAVGMFGSFSYLQSKSARPQPHGWMIPDISAAEKQQVIDKANVLRDKWRPWAMAHRVELQQMLGAKSGDQDAFATMWQKLPVIPVEAGITSQDLVPTGDPTVGIGFGWAPLSKANQHPSPAMEKSMKKIEERDANARKMSSYGQPAFTGERRDDFNKQRDINIATCAKGRTWTTLWASGRITEKVKISPEARRELSRKLRAEGRRIRASDLFGPSRQVMAPYDFLTQSTT